VRDVEAMGGGSPGHAKDAEGAMHDDVAPCGARGSRWKERVVVKWGRARTSARLRQAFHVWDGEEATPDPTSAAVVQEKRTSSCKGSKEG
jgi:hypothetical protein